MTAMPLHAEVAADAFVTVTATAQRDADAAAARERIARTPGGASVTEASEFADRLAVNFRDTLAFAPGVFAQSRFGEEVRLSIRGSGIGRGFHLRGVTLLQDGVPINLADGSGDFQELDPTVFQRIEVYRGANALRFGASSLGGAINAVTPTGRTAPTLALRLEGGSFGTARATAQAGLADGPGDGFIAVSYLRDDGYRAQSAQEKLRVNGNIGLQLSDAVETRFYGSMNFIDQQVPGTLTRVQALTTPRAAPATNIVNAYARDIRSLRVQNRTRFDLGATRIEAGLFLNAKDLFHPIFQVIDQKSTDWGGYARLDTAGNVAGVKVEATLGTTLRTGKTAAKQYLNIGGRRGALTANVDQFADAFDGYGEVRVYPVATLALVGGAQFTHGKRRVDNKLNPAMNAERSFDEWSPKIGAIWTPARDVQVFANYNRAVEIPTFSEIVQAPIAGFVPLDPQRGWTLEVGTRGRTGVLAWDLSLYRADLRGELLGFTVDPDVPAATFNADRTRHQGIEAGLDIVVASWMTLRQVYQYNDFTFRGDAQYGNNRIAVVPEHLYRAEVQLGNETVRVAPNVEWIPRGAFADYRNTVRNPGYALIGVSGSVAVAQGVRLFADGRNLANKRGIGDVSAVVQATPASAIYYPVEGRAVFGGIRAAF
ncbi:TonB-dependent receptor family protein [Polymorphobacter fuscus]|nr:TonB-dependent receptor [Polymorphobacter fuscus]NJC09887.1 iron complex outermembrane receptor protein [Polymorphobacter fuscus]